MSKKKKNALIVWAITLAVFGAYILFALNNNELQNTSWLQETLLKFIALDVVTGVTAFLIALLEDTKETMKLKLHISKTVKILGAFVFATGIVFVDYVLKDLAKEELTALVEYTGPMQSVPSPLAETTPTPQVLEEPKHGYQSKPIVNLKYESYMVRGRTREELCEAITKWQEKNDWGRRLAYIKYEIKPSYHVIYTSKGYTIGDFTVTTNSIIMLPQWESSGGASDGTKSDWRSFKNAVESHERQHHDILLEYANKLIQEYNKLGYYPTEQATLSALQEKYDKNNEQMDKAQEKFDDKYGESKSYGYLCR